MNFNGKTLIIIGFILFILQLGNFFSIDTISPAFERAQVLSAISSVIIVLIGFLFKQFNPNNADRVELKGENKFLFDSDIPTEILDELAWGSESILTSTAAATLLIHNDGKNIFRSDSILISVLHPFLFNSSFSISTTIIFEFLRALNL